MIWIADFEEGHTPPDRALLIELLGTLTCTPAKLLPLVEELDELSVIGDDPVRRPMDLRSARHTFDQTISIQRTHNTVRVVADCVPDGFGNLRWQAVASQAGRDIATSQLFETWGLWQVPDSPGTNQDFDVRVLVFDGFGNVIAQQQLTKNQVQTDVDKSS
ncbi:hypothetical protein [Gulosibacter sediminis]|uniref:hypothetical protein n=1 Tax=Gulosibacter sediminis TaxID=1729695 RepID=UPI0024ADACB3|nr:hypothetical protein [Gulosibacter sediminis]